MAARQATARVARRISVEDFGRLERIASNVAAHSAGSYEAGLETLRAAILDGTLPPGARLPQEDLATLMHDRPDPRPPIPPRPRVRGLVRSEPHRGYTVTDLEPDDIEQIYHLRIVLESHAVRLAIPLRTAEDLREIEAIHDLLLFAADPAGALVLRDQFRARLYGVTNRPRLTAAIVRLRQEVARTVIGRPHHHRPGDLTVFLAAVRAGDAAVRDLTAHYQQTSALLRRYLRERKHRRPNAGRIAPSSPGRDGRLG